MERSKFIRLFYRASDQLDKKRLRSIIRRSVKSNGKDKQLIQQTSKTARGMSDKMCLMEEMGDVILGLAYLQEMCEISTLELYKAINVKMDRLEQVLNEKGVYL